VGSSILADRALDRLYAIPRDTVSLEDWHRRRHLDLPDHSDLDLDRESFGVMLRIYRERHPGAMAWLAERRAAIRRELGRRRAAARSASDREPARVTWGRRPPAAPSPGPGTNRIGPATRPPLIVRKDGRTTTR